MMNFYSRVICGLSQAAMVATAIAGVVSVPPAKAQTQNTGRCMDTRDPIYIAERRISVRGIVRGCENGAFDLTPAPYAIKPGERLMIAACRYQQQLPNAIVRARMNTPYLLNPAHKADMNAVPYTTNPGYRWRNTSRALPFVPTRILDMGQQQGYPVYAYSALRFLPSRIGDAYPLNQSSVIIAIDGCMFSSPNALAAMLNAPGGKDYVEVTYFQEGEPGRPLRRAFLPMYARSSVNSEWTRLTDAHPIFDPNPAGRIVTALFVIGLAKLFYEFSQSSLGQQLARDYNECVRRNEPLIIC